MVKAVVIILCLTLTACVTREVVIAPYVPDTTRPTLAHVGPEDLDCLTDHAFGRIDENERLMIEYAEKLEVILNSVRDFGRR